MKVSVDNEVGKQANRLSLRPLRTLRLELVFYINRGQHFMLEFLQKQKDWFFSFAFLVCFVGK